MHRKPAASKSQLPILSWDKEAKHTWCQHLIAYRKILPMRVLCFQESGLLSANAPLVSRFREALIPFLGLEIEPALSLRSHHLMRPRHQFAIILCAITFRQHQRVLKADPCVIAATRCQRDELPRR